MGAGFSTRVYFTLSKMVAERGYSDEAFQIRNWLMVSTCWSNHRDRLVAIAVPAFGV